MNKKEFLHSTPHDVYTVIDAFYEKRESDMKLMEHKAWLNGYYVQHAIACCFDKSHDFPENPLLRAESTTKAIAERNGKTEEEINQELLLMTLCVREANAKLAELDG